MEALMFELIEIINDDATRFVKIKNIDNDTIEECFDDSAVVSSNNFSFMQIGQQYECKIKLFGKPVSEQRRDGVICKIIDRNAKIGQKIMVEVEVNSNRYFIPQAKVKDYLNYDSFIFCFTRKDLIQVNTITHADLL